MSTKQAVIEQALKLPADDRLAVVEALYDSLEGPADPDVQQAWSDEIARRLNDISSGRATFIPWDEARRQIVGGHSDDSAAG